MNLVGRLVKPDIFIFLLCLSLISSTSLSVVSLHDLVLWASTLRNTLLERIIALWAYSGKKESSRLWMKAMA